MMRSKTIRLMMGMGALAAGTACSSESEPGMAPSEARISIADEISAGAAAPLLYASVNGVLVAVSPDTVESLEIEFTDIAYLPVSSDEEAEGEWQTLVLDAPVTLDLMALPTEAEGSIVIGSGTVPVGSYRKVRLMVGEGEIVFTGPLSVGAAATFDGGTPYPVTIPSGDQTGLKTDVSFEVTAGEGGTANAANIVFVPGTTFQNVTVTGNGRVMLSPVLRSK